MTHRFLQALRGEATDCSPVWFMRQAGRYQKEYREIRKRHSILDICRTAELSAAATMIPIEVLPGVDAAIIFSDLLLILEPMGIQVEFTAGEGPSIRNPVATAADVEALKAVEPERDLKAVLDAIRIVKRQLAGRVPLIGFAGAPFTLASYLVEGGPSKHFLKTKALMMGRPDIWRKLMTRLAAASAAHLKAQAAAGAEVVQVFDSWVGAVSPADYRESVLPYTRMIFDALRGSVPAIHFGTDTAGLLPLMKEAGGDAIGVDWRIPLDDAWSRIGKLPIQGNLDPAALLAPLPELLRRVDEVLERAAGRPGHIFNLGHGILPETPVENVAAVIDHVHRKTAR